MVVDLLVVVLLVVLGGGGGCLLYFSPLFFFLVDVAGVATINCGVGFQPSMATCVYFRSDKESKGVSLGRL